MTPPKLKYKPTRELSPEACTFCFAIGGVCQLCKEEARTSKPPQPVKMNRYTCVAKGCDAECGSNDSYCSYHQVSTSSPFNPGHYGALSPEPIDVIESWGLEFHLANALKYIARAGKKDGNPEAQDLRKAVRYLSRRINQLEGKKGWELNG